MSGRIWSLLPRDNMPTWEKPIVDGRVSIGTIIVDMPKSIFSGGVYILRLLLLAVMTSDGVGGGVRKTTGGVFETTGVAEEEDENGTTTEGLGWRFTTLFA